MEQMEVQPIENPMLENEGKRFVLFFCELESSKYSSFCQKMAANPAQTEHKLMESWRATESVYLSMPPKKSKTSENDLIHVHQDPLKPLKTKNHVNRT